MSCLRTFLLIAAAFCITIDAMGFIRFPGGGHNDTDCKPQQKKQCPEGSIAVTRTPTANNNHTSLWCLQVFVRERYLVSSFAKALCAAKNGGVLSAFENQAEQDIIYEKAYALFKEKGITMGSITVDGRRKPECMKNDTNMVPPCTQTGTFAFNDSHTDPAFTFSKWYKNLPDGPSEPIGANIVVAGQYFIESCIHMYITRDLYPKYDKYFHDMFCEFAVSPLNSGQIYSSYGYVCGWEPKPGNWSINA